MNSTLITFLMPLLLDSCEKIDVKSLRMDITFKDGREVIFTKQMLIESLREQCSEKIMNELFNERKQHNGMEKNT